MRCCVAKLPRKKPLWLAFEVTVVTSAFRGYVADSGTLASVRYHIAGGKNAQSAKL